MNKVSNNIPEKANKSFPFLVVMVIILFLGSVSLIVLNYLNIYILPTQEVQKEHVIEDTMEETTKDRNEGATSLPIDVSRYTDIQLKDYSNLYVTTTEPFTTPEEPQNDIFVTYYIKSYIDSPLQSNYEKQKLYGPNMTMEIISKDTLRTDIGKSKFDLEVLNIKNLDIDPTDTPSIGWVQDIKYSDSMKKRNIHDIEYPNTENTFAFFAIPIYPAGAIYNPDLEDNIGIRLNIFVQAIKEDNIITLKSEISDTEFLGITREEHMNCTEVGSVDGAKTGNTSQNSQLEKINSKFIHSIHADDSYYGTALYYDFDCMLNLLTSEKYYNKIVDYANELVDTFEIKG